MNSTSTTTWDAPFWWISGGGDAYGTSSSKSTAPGTPAARLGSYWRNAFAMYPGSGFGLRCAGCSAGPGFVYRVDVTQPDSTVSTNIIFGVCSTNCAIGGLSGGAGYATNTTAFQAQYSANKWGFVCWLTNTVGVPNPEIEFHYVTGGQGDTLKHFADCVKFTLISPVAGPARVRILGMGGGLMAYEGGAGTNFVLLKAPNLRTALGSWQRVATNSATPGSFAIPSLAEGSAFYAIASE